jgi:hypothetical protein
VSCVPRLLVPKQRIPKRLRGMLADRPRAVVALTPFEFLDRLAGRRRTAGMETTVATLEAAATHITRPAFCQAAASRTVPLHQIRTCLLRA